MLKLTIEGCRCVFERFHALGLAALKPRINCIYRPGDPLGWRGVHRHCTSSWEKSLVRSRPGASGFGTSHHLLACGFPRCGPNCTPIIRIATHEGGSVRIGMHGTCIYHSSTPHLSREIFRGSPEEYHAGDATCKGHLGGGGLSGS